MATWVWILIAIVVVAIVVVFGSVRLKSSMRRRSSRLRQRFGPEYDRTVETRQGRRSAEAELRARERQREQLAIKPLPESTRLLFAHEWRDVQERFVDQPVQAVAAADALITRVMQTRGYPTIQFEAQAAVVSVDHPHVVENYRFGHAVSQRSQTQQVSTEELREALLRFRSLFDELLQPETAQTAAAADPADAGEQIPSPAEVGTEAVAARSAGGAATSAVDPVAAETGDKAHQDQRASGGRS